MGGGAGTAMGNIRGDEKADRSGGEVARRAEWSSMRVAPFQSSRPPTYPPTYPTVHTQTHPHTYTEGKIDPKLKTQSEQPQPKQCRRREGGRKAEDGSGQRNVPPQRNGDMAGCGMGWTKASSSGTRTEGWRLCVGGTPNVWDGNNIVATTTTTWHRNDHRSLMMMMLITIITT